MADRDKRVTDPALTQRAPQDVALPTACLTAREAASFLQLNEKKLYELANSQIGRAHV